MNVAALLVLALLTFRISQLKVLTAHTTAESARRWALVACAACLLVAISRIEVVEVSAKNLSAAHYLSCVMLLTPLVAMLGARRPGTAAWGWFVVLPLIVVLQWPSLSQLSAGNADTPILVPTPTVIGFLFVLLMGAGNYFGTLNTLAMAFGMLGTVLILLPVTEFGSDKALWMFPVGCSCLLLGAFAIPRQLFADRSPPNDRNAQHVELWRDFRDVYGIVWAKRVVDRFNQFAARENLPVELTLEGFRNRGAHDGSQIASDTDAAVNIPDRATAVLCWILKRFLDHEFLRRYLPDSGLPPNPMPDRS